MSHTIAASSTGNVVSAIGILRLTGEGCIDIAGKVFTLNSGKPLAEAPPAEAGAWTAEGSAAPSKIYKGHAVCVFLEAHLTIYFGEWR